MKILITGGTGFIGKRVVREMSASAEVIFLLTRPRSLAKARKSFSDLKNIHYIVGDVTTDDVIEDYHERELVKNEASSILNIAGNYNLEITEFDAYKNNVIGVQNILNLAKEMKTLEVIHHISTYAVIGNLSGKISEDEMDQARNFNDFYAKSKMQGENILRHTDLGEIKKRIYRPGIVIGATDNGKIEKVDGPYYLMKFLYENKKYLKSLSLIKKFPLPFSEDSYLPLIPVDYLSAWLCHAMNNVSAHTTRSYNFFGENPVTIKEFTQYLLESYGIDATPMQLKESKVYNLIMPKIGMPKELLQYMYSGAKYEVENRKSDFPELSEYSMPEITKKLIEGSNKYFQEQR